jgi:hypothetical protein
MRAALAAVPGHRWKRVVAVRALSEFGRDGSRTAEASGPGGGGSRGGASSGSYPVKQPRRDEVAAVV